MGKAFKKGSGGQAVEPTLSRFAFFSVKLPPIDPAPVAA